MPPGWVGWMGIDIGKTVLTIVSTVHFVSYTSQRTLYKRDRSMHARIGVVETRAQFHRLHDKKDTRVPCIVRWIRYRPDVLWITLYLLLNLALAVWRFLCYPPVLAIWYWPAIAKASAELILLNVTVALVSICNQLLDIFRRRLPTNVLQLPILKQLALHKIAGVITLAASLIHSFAWIYILIILKSGKIDKPRLPHIFNNIKFLLDASWSEALMQWPIVSGLLLMALTLVAIPLTFPCFRNRFFGCFTSSHTVIFGLFVLLTLTHGLCCWLGFPQSIAWCLVPFCWYVYERSHRLPVSSAKAQVVSYEYEDDVLFINFRRPLNFRCSDQPGAYVKVLVPTVSRIEWHPFSLVSAPSDELLRLQIRCRGDWTTALFKLLQHHPVDEVYIDGASGSPTQRALNYRTIVLLSTGIGVTPFLSVLRHVFQSLRSGHPTKVKRIYFIWSTRGWLKVYWVMELLDEFRDVSDQVDLVIKVHITSEYEKTVAEASDQVTIEEGRVDWQEELIKVQADTHEHVGAFICSNKALSKELKLKIASVNIGRKQDGIRFDTYAEVF